MRQRLTGLIVCGGILMFLAADGWCERDYGLGIIAGEPSGLSGKMWLSDDMAVDCGMAWSFADDASINIHSEVLWHDWHILDDALEIDDTGRLPLYYGVGGRIKAAGETRVGVRFVVGAAFMFNYAPFDVFVELAPIMDLAPKTELRFNAAVGGRFWF